MIKLKDTLKKWKKMLSFYASEDLTTYTDSIVEVCGRCQYGTEYCPLCPVKIQRDQMYTDYTLPGKFAS